MPAAATSPKLTYESFAVVAPGLEPIVAAELRSLGVSKIVEQPGGVAFTCDAQGLARVNLSLRAASRVLVRLAQFTAKEFRSLELSARRVEWARVIANGARVQVRASCKKSKLYHSGAVAQRVENEIARAVPGAAVQRAGAESETDDGQDDDAQMIVVRVDHDRCTISADSSGALLHRRGYRQAIAKAPLRETLGAAMLLGAGYDASLPMADPMCGSGTLAIEAAMIARRIAPGLARTFAAERWPESSAAAWTAARTTARARVLPKAPAPIYASDRDEGAVAAARANAERAGVAADITFAVQTLSAFAPSESRGLLISNPPYGVRVGETKPLRDLYARYGQVVRTKCQGWDAALLSADRALERQTQLQLEELFSTKNGGIPVRLVRARGATGD